MDGRPDRFSLSGFMFRQAQTLFGFAIFLLLALAVAALATWNVADPSYSYATGNQPTNILGYGGAAFADIAMQFFGLASVVALLPVVAWALALISGRRFSRIPARAAAWGLGSVLSSAVIGCFPPPLTWPIPNGIGGVIGDMILRFPALFVGAYPTGAFATAVGCVFAVPTIWMMLFAAGIVGRSEDDEEEAEEAYANTRSKLRSVGDEDEDDDEGGWLAFGALTHAWYMSQARMRRLLGMGPRKRRQDDFESPYDFNDDEFGKLNEPVRAKAPAGRGDRMEPSMEPRAASQRRIVSTPSISLNNDDDDDDLPFDDMPPRPADILPDDDDWMMRAPAKATGRAEPRVVQPPARPKPGARLEREQQGSFIRPRASSFRRCTFSRNRRMSCEIQHYLPTRWNRMRACSRACSRISASRARSSTFVPVRSSRFTNWNLRLGIKSSRVIGLADDIARSMSAIAARVAVVPGRNAIGIELPNSTRETVYLRELIASRDFEGSKAKLAMALGKTIGGEAVIADLAKMPHLLVAGTTGSGKSVAINTMILSLLYRMTPEQCRLIMIDPKMLELSVYDGIPHLLSPVVTDPKKAVVALKWTVREMEERYKKMSKIGVRNIDGFNSRVEQALAKGEVISRTVQTGFDRHTGEAMYETEEFDLQPMPYIVVIIDEMADLMMVAGKDIEGAVQRLAQMARAAGIHVIMATQRPSVDVITGTIKANFPTRISFQVTSKIDSRTILGEQGAEQLLGMGDMLYMAGGGRIQRVHGPFVADMEVEEIVSYLKTQGSPQYLDAITADDDEDGDYGGGPAGTSNLSDSDDPYDQAVAIVLRDGKASTSYIQRRLGIGYNRAASLIERMEQEGIIGPANHAGKREILVPTEDDILDR